MKNYLSLLGLIILFGCKQDNNICVDIKNTKTSEHQKFNFSKTFIVPPIGYKQVPKFPRFEKDPEHFISITESRQNFGERKHFFSKQSLDSMKVKYDNYCEIMLNQYTAYIISSFANKEMTMKKIELAFGDRTFSTIIYATYPVNDNDAEIEIINSIKTLYHDNDLLYNPLDESVFNIDLKNTNFKLVDANSAMYVFTIDGKGDPYNKDMFEPKFTVYYTPYIPDSDTNEIKNYVKDFYYNLAQNGGVSITKTDLQHSFSNNKLFCYHSRNEISFKGKNGLSYMFVTTGWKGNLVFIGDSYKDIEIYRKQFPEIAKSLTFK